MYVVKYTKPKMAIPELEDLMNDVVCKRRSRRIESTIVKKCNDLSNESLPFFDPAKWMRDANTLLSAINNFIKNQDLNGYYHVISIPKNNGKTRTIHDPNKSMRVVHDLMMDWLSPYMYYHTSAFAYIKKRNIYDCIQRHQGNESKWFLHIDLKDFFGQTNYDFAMRQIFSIYPFCSLSQEDQKVVKSILKIAFLNNRLPQGTTISPALTNLIMLPIDHKIYGDMHKKGMVYTRYADDIIISSPYDFDYEKIIRRIKTIFDQFGAPYQINDEKTRYGSSSGKNWNLGLMLNKDNQITVGYRAKKLMKAKLTAYYLDQQNNVNQSAHENQKMFGQLAFYKMIEPHTMNYIDRKLSSKFNVKSKKHIKSANRSRQCFVFQDIDLPFL